MGLFGGFRAKFSRTSRPKETDSRTGVVPLNYRIHSEFDSDSSPSQYSNEIQDVTFRPVTKARPPTRSATFEDHKRALQEKLKSQSFAYNTTNPPVKRRTPPLKDKRNVKEPSKTNEKSIRFQEQPTLYDEEYNKTNSMYTKSTEPKSIGFKEHMKQPALPVEESNYIYTGFTGSIHHYEQVTPTEEHCVSYEDTPSTLIMMTQHEPEDTKLKPKPAANTFHHYDDQDDEGYNIVNNETTNDPEQFKVNVVHHDKNYYSEDEMSYVEDEAPPSFTGYSQAANIFFGDDTAPPPIRPRKMNKINLGNDGDEEDC